jgi:hypothetical protein
LQAATCGENAISAKDYSVVGDGIADDTAAVQAAVTAGTGKSVLFPPGTYKISSPIIISSHTTVVGAGPRSTIFKPIGSSVSEVFQNTNYATEGGAYSILPTTVANQTNSKIGLMHLGFDFSVNTGNIASFLLAQKIVIDDIEARNDRPYTAPGYGGVRLIGCDDVRISNIHMQNVGNAIDSWKGTTRVKIVHVSVEIADGGGNGGAFNLQGVGTNANDMEHSWDYEAKDVSIKLHNNGLGFFLDSQGAGSITSDVLLEDIDIVALTGTAAGAVIGRGRGGRLKLHNITVQAKSGASFGSQPILIGAFLSYIVPATGTGLVATRLGSSVITVHFPNGTDIGAGNYVKIDDGYGGAVRGNGLTLSGYYLVTNVSGPSSGGRSGNVVTASIPANATATGTIDATTRVSGYQGTFNGCELSGITFDGAMAPGADLIAIQGSNHRIDGVTVTKNYGASSIPQYRSIVSWDGSLQPAGRAIQVTHIVGAPGSGPLAHGWIGNNILQWNPSSPTPIRSTTSLHRRMPRPRGKCDSRVNFATMRSRNPRLAQLPCSETSEADPETDPALQSIVAGIPASVETVATLAYTYAALTPGAPSLAAARN